MRCNKCEHARDYIFYVFSFVYIYIFVAQKGIVNHYSFGAQGGHEAGRIRRLHGSEYPKDESNTYLHHCRRGLHCI